LGFFGFQEDFEPASIFLGLLGSQRNPNGELRDIHTDKDEIIRKASIKVRDIMRKVND
jgi:hypothetical protein